MKGGKGGKEKSYIYKELRGEYKSLTVGEVMPDGGAFVCWVSTNIIMRYVCISCIVMWYVVCGMVCVDHTCGHGKVEKKNNFM